MTIAAQATLGTLLRATLDRLDAAVEAAYRGLPLDYRPRYTPVVRILLAQGKASIREIAAATGTTHSAASQTVAQMVKAGLVTLGPSGDGRERIAALTPAAAALIPDLRRHWAATEAAAAALEAELPMPLSALLRETLAALDRRPFSERLAAAQA
jgi:DNA-binding MarR family transcriptional regulator